MRPIPGDAAWRARFDSQKGLPWDLDVKASDDSHTPQFADYFERLGLPNVSPKKSFDVLARHVPSDEIDWEIREKLDVLGRVAGEEVPAPILPNADPSIPRGWTPFGNASRNQRAVSGD